MSASTVAANLLRGVAVSENGLGIGLCQAARWAGQLGCRVALMDNWQGEGVY